MNPRTTLSLLLALALGIRLGNLLSERRLQSETEDLLSVLPRPADEPRVGQAVQFVGRDGVTRAARISRVVDAREGVVDLHVDQPSPERPTVIEHYVPPRRGELVYSWQPVAPTLN